MQKLQGAPNKQQLVEKSKAYSLSLAKESKAKPYLLNIALTSNPFLKDQDAYKMLKFQLSEYNKRVEKGEVNDPYEMASYERLHSIISDLAQIDTREDQLKSLQEVSQWFKEQHRLVEQRRNQGEIRYKILKQVKDQEEDKKEELKMQDNPHEIPAELIKRLTAPFNCNNRTVHKELDIPIRRLNEYKRKIINIAPFIEPKEEVKAPRILYPLPPKHQQIKEEVEEPKGDGQIPLDGPPELKEAQGEVKQEQDLGNFGEQPEQPPEEEEAEEDTKDPLCPRNKLFVEGVHESKEKTYKQPYMFYRGTDITPERNMELRYIKRSHDILRRNKEDQLDLEIAHEWAKKKSKMSKEIQKKLEEMKFKPEYSFSLEEQPKEEMLSALDQLKFGFTTAVRVKSKRCEFDLNSSELPPINYRSLNEKSIRKDRLNSLKGKFNKLLNLSEQQERETVPSMCQYSVRRRNLSEIMRNHSHSKERLQQLEEVTTIKEKLTSVKIGVNIKALSRGLCLPENEEHELESDFPMRDLPSNPFLVETKKKKKK